MSQLLRRVAGSPWLSAVVSGLFLVHGTSERLGTYTTLGNAPELISKIGLFFGKSTVTACQPWQSDKSWLYNGTLHPGLSAASRTTRIVYDSHSAPPSKAILPAHP